MAEAFRDANGSGEQLFAHLDDVAGAHGQDQVARPGDLAQPLLNQREGGVVFRIGYFPGHLLRADAQIVLLPGGIDIGQDHLVRQGERLQEVLIQRLGAGVGMGLEHADDAIKIHLPRRAQRGRHLAGVVGVIVHHQGAV